MDPNIVTDAQDEELEQALEGAANEEVFGETSNKNFAQEEDEEEEVFGV